MFGQKGCDRSGGIEVVVTELSRRMARQGLRIVCYNRSASLRPSRFRRRKSVPGCPGSVEERYVPTWNRKGLAAATSSFFAAAAAAIGPYDIVHVHAEGPAAMCWIPKLFGKKVVCTIHGLDHQREKWKGAARAYIKFGEYCAARWADGLIVLSRSSQDYFRQKYQVNGVYIPNGVSRPRLREASRIKETFGLKRDGYILFLGRLVPEKGLRYLIQAYKGLHTEKKLVIAGGASDLPEFKQELEELAKGDERILFTGFVQGSLLEELYSNAYIYTLPSDLEGMPLSLLEAMSYGNCCLVSDIPECVEVVEEQAVIFHKGDVKDLREKLQKLCDDTAMVEQYRRTAADWICRKYSWNETAERTIALYQNLLKTSSRRNVWQKKS